MMKLIYNYAEVQTMWIQVAFDKCGVLLERKIHLVGITTFMCLTTSTILVVYSSTNYGGKSRACVSLGLVSVFRRKRFLSKGDRGGV